MAGKKAVHIAPVRRSLTLKSSLFFFFLFSIPLFLSPRAVAKDSYDDGHVTPPPLFLVGEPPITKELAGRLMNVAPTFEPLEASAGVRAADDGDGGEDGEGDSQGVEDGGPPVDYPDVETVSAPDITRGPKDRMELSITFDGGGYDCFETLEILKVLRDRGIKTTIFLTGRFISKYPEVVRLIAEDGHEVGNHTFDHPHLTEFTRNFRQRTLKGVDRSTLAAELRKTDELFKKTAGMEMVPLWRAPYGEENADIRRWAFEEGYMHVGWTSGKGESLDTLDWVDDKASRLYRTPEEIKERVLGFGQSGQGINGGIILMHLSSGRTDNIPAMLGELLDELRARGYRFVKVTELLRDSRALKAMEDRRVKDVLAQSAAMGEKSVAQSEPLGQTRN